MILDRNFNQMLCYYIDLSCYENLRRASQELEIKEDLKWNQKAVRYLQKIRKDMVYYHVELRGIDSIVFSKKIKVKHGSESILRSERKIHNCIMRW